MIPSLRPLLVLAASLSVSANLAAQQQPGTPIGGGAQTGTQPMGGQSTAQTTAPQSGVTGGVSNSGAQGVGTGPSTFQAPAHPVVTTDRNLLFPAGRDVELTYGDQISVRIYGDTEYSPVVRIGTDGKVLLPLIGVVNLKNLGINAAEELIASRLRDAGMFKDPQVIVQLLDGPSAFVTIIGETHGVIPITGPRRLLDVLAAAGGLPATASHIVTIERTGQPALIVDLGNDPQSSEMANVPIFPGDTVVVAHLGVVYIVGEFKTQGAIPLTSGSALTLLQATALSGGPVYDAKYDDLRLIRTNGDQRTVVKLDIHKVLYGKSPDPILQAGDIIFLPSSTLKQAIQSGGVNALLTLANLAITSIAVTR
jgi:polysaccharide biosynthesis/export protein